MVFSLLHVENDHSAVLIIGMLQKIHNGILTATNEAESHKFNAVIEFFGSGIFLSQNLRYHNCMLDLSDDFKRRERSE